MHPDPFVEPAPSGWSRFVAGLRGGAGAAIGLAITAAVILAPIFKPGFLVLLSRTGVVAALLLAAYAAARAWPPRWIPRWMPPWLVPALAIALAAPPATLAVYFVLSGGVRPFIAVPERISGSLFIAGTGIVLGLSAALAAAFRERLAQAEARALRLELDRSRLEQQAAEARLASLQAQIEPHFLFNTLANVQALVESGSPRAAPVLKSLIAYLRAAMPRLQDGGHTLGRELDMARAYLELMQLRMPDRLAFSIDEAGAPRDRPFPPLALLTLVENAVRHGIDPSEEGGRIEVGARRDGGSLRVWVADTGLGMDPHAQPGSGLANLRDRLRVFWGGQASLVLDEVAPHGVRAEIRVAA